MGVFGAAFGFFVGLQIDLDNDPDWPIVWTALGAVASFAVVVVALIPIWIAWSIRRARQNAVRRLFLNEIESARYAISSRMRLPTAEDHVRLQGLLDQTFAEVLTLDPLEIEIVSYAVSRVRGAWSSPVNTTALSSAKDVLGMAQMALSGELDLTRAETVGDALVQYGAWKRVREEALLSER